MAGRDEDGDDSGEGQGDIITPNMLNKFEFPRDCLKQNTEINNEGDFRHLLMSLRYWLVEAMPESVMEFALTASNREMFLRVAEEFETALVALQSLKAVA